MTIGRLYDYNVKKKINRKGAISRQKITIYGNNIHNLPSEIMNAISPIEGDYVNSLEIRVFLNEI